MASRAGLGARFTGGLALALPALVVALFSGGCATWRGRAGGQESGGRIALRSVPEIREVGGRGDRGVLEAFFRASGVAVGEDALAEMIPDWSAEGALKEGAVRRAARKGGRVAMGVKADEAGLAESLRKGRVLLAVLPKAGGRVGAHPLCIPVAWDRGGKVVEVLGGDGVAKVGEEEFFGRREGLGHAALWLCKPGEARRAGAGRSQRLALADFWFGEGEWRKAEEAYGEAAESDTPGDARGLTGQADSLARRGKFRAAAALYRKALELDPESARAMNNLAYALVQSGDGLMEALRLARTAAEREPGNPAFLETVGSAHLALGDAELAARYFELAWGRALRREASVQVAIMDQLIRAWLAAGRHEMAQQVAEARVREFPEFRFPKDLRGEFPSLEKKRRAAGKK